MQKRFRLSPMIVLLSGILCFMPGTVPADGNELTSSRWIVQLEAMPVVRYGGEGGTLMGGEAAKMRGPGLAATAPAVTGADRLDVSRPEVRAYTDWLDRQRHELLGRAGQTLGRELEPVHVYRYLQNGFAIDLKPEEARRLAELPGVSAVEPDRMHYLHLERGPQLIGADAIWSGQVDGMVPVQGENVVIGVLDSGVNWNHAMFSDDPADTGGYVLSNPFGRQLGLCSRQDVPCNNKLIGVYDFTNEGNGKDLGGHGSHVAAIAAGNRRTVGLDFGGGVAQFTLSGVAPRANLISYKVCREDFDAGSEAECPGSAIVQGLEQAIEDGVHVVNYSIGTSQPVDPWLNIGQTGVTEVGELFLNLRAAGIVPVTSAGNSGTSGPGTISTPANAPWTIAVGNSTHDRFLANRAEVAGLSDLIALAGDGPTLGSDLTAPVIAAESIDPANVLACDPFAAGVFEDAIAVVVRGACTFELKVDNAYHAGAVAVLVVNNIPGPPISMGGLESAAIPAFMLGNGDGIEVLKAIADTAEPKATIESGIVSLASEELRDRIAPSSSRGPAAFAPGLMKPNLVAPGSVILSAGAEGSDSYAVLTGTSMAGPHIAGAAALLLSARPDWTVDMIQSALETTAERDTLRVDNMPASINDRGAGRARVDRAVNAGLFLPVTSSQFRVANPRNGGDPGKLNLPGIYTDSCTRNCAFTRTVEAIRPGSWTVSVRGDLDIEVVPDSFSLAAGARQQLNITVSGGNTGADAVLDGAVVLTPADDSLSTQHLPVGMAFVAADLPSQLLINAPGNRGHSDHDVEVQATIEEAVFRTSSLVRPHGESFELEQDTSPGDPFSGGDGTKTLLVEVPEDTLMLMVDTVDSSALDIDLYVGRDLAGNGEAAPNEVVCEAASIGSREQCRIHNPEPGTWWILVQNYLGSSGSGVDWVKVEYAVLQESEDYSLTVTGPGRHDGGQLPFSLVWDQPAMRRGERWVGAVGLASSDEELADLGVIPVGVRRTMPLSHEPTPLFANQLRPVVVAANQRHDLLYFDVSPGAAAVSVSVQGVSGVSAELRHMAFDEIAAHAPGTPPAAGDLKASHGGSSGFTLTADAEPGRWYLVLDNARSSEALVEVNVVIEEDEPLMSQRGLWSPRDRTIYQGIEWQRAGKGFMTWYSYDRAGLPVFYQAIGDIDPAVSTWTAPLERVTNGSGERQVYDRIGEVSLTMISDKEMVFSWRRDGFHGSEIMTPDAARTCPQVEGGVTSYSGHWYSPGRLVGGTTMIVTDNVQAHIRYYFDALGIGRWLLASDPESDPLNQVLELLDYRGFCPGCDETGVQMHSVGVYERSFESDSSGTERLDFISAEPLGHAVSIEVPVSKLSEPLECH
jgi:subtilisin family serine protease